MTSRRDFLKYIGFSTAAAALAACEGPVHKSIPYLVQPEEIVPSQANYYATCIADGFDFASVLVKTLEGRPILIEPNPDARCGKAVNARILASLLSLYDSNREIPQEKAGKWELLDRDTRAALAKAKAEGKQIVLLSQTLASPSAYALIEELKAEYPTFQLIEYDTISEDATLLAFRHQYGRRAMPDYNFSKAKLIVSFAADFLGDWNGGGYADSYAQGRIPTKTGGMSRHIQFESNLSLTGANADERIALPPALLQRAFAQFYNFCKGYPLKDKTLPPALTERIIALAKEVRQAGSEALIVTGIDLMHVPLLAFELNEELQSAAFGLRTPRLTRQGYSAMLYNLIADMQEGKVGVLFINNLNPLYSLAKADGFAEGLAKVPFSVSFALRADETALKTTYIAPQPHYLEAWGDVQFKYGHYGLMQPCIRPLFNTRQWQDCFLQWLGRPHTYYDYIRAYWQEHILGNTPWEVALQNGTFVREDEVFTPVPPIILTKMSCQELAYGVLASAKATTDFQLTLYPSTALGDGQQANNPWLQELPDPISRATWDNYLTMHPADAKRLGIENWHTANGALCGHTAKVTAQGESVVVPVYLMEGQAQGSVGLALGYGRQAGLPPEMQVGVNAFVLYRLYKRGNQTQDVTIEKVGGEHTFACMQLQNSLEGRDNVLKELTLAQYQALPPVVPLSSPSVKKEGHHFKLSIDLNACIGCGACVIACHAENNVPVVGKEEVSRSRDMHWLRIDRYYSEENKVGFQPVMCQHCEKAPCETVCPVGATVHGAQGQNQMAYNRCVGTRYCANNCPYKVRRFNWFDYSQNPAFNYNMNSEVGRMLLNPDVTVRTRGVMEKCSLCIQRTQEVILRAKREGHPVAADAFSRATACAAACTTGAIRFGDANNPEDPIVPLTASDHMYHLLEQLGTQPNVIYQTKIRNTDKTNDEA